MINYDKKSKKIIIPEGTTEIPDEAFIGYEDLEEIVLPSTLKSIGNCAFAECKKLKKIDLPKGLIFLGNQAFANCTALEEITIPKSIHYFSNGLFSYCKNLKTINSHDDIEYIDDFALYNCRNLKDFNLPKNIKSIGIKAMMGCNQITSLNIPSSLNNIEHAAFALMTSLSQIKVDKDNPIYADDEEIGLYDKERELFIQYAINCKEKEYVIGYFLVDICEATDELTGELVSTKTIRTIRNISDYAFAGSKYLEKLCILSDLDSYGERTFLNCQKLKNLEIYNNENDNIFMLSLQRGFPRKRVSIPFENIEFKDGITVISDNTSDIFKNASNIILPNTIEQIGSKVFSSSQKLKRLDIPATIKAISPHTFYPTTLLHFADLGNLTGKDFNMLETKTSLDYYMNELGKDNIRIFSLQDGTYYVSINGFQTIKINRDEIRSLSHTSNILQNDPDVFITYLSNLLKINVNHNDMMANIFNSKKLLNTFKTFVSDMDYVVEIANNRHQRAIEEILKEHDLNDEFLFNGILMRKLSYDELKKIIENMSPSLERFFRFSHFFDPDFFNQDYDHNQFLLSKLTQKQEFYDYCNLLEKYQQYDRFLYNPNLVLYLTPEQQEKLISKFNSNIKRLINASGILEDNKTDGENIKDLFKFMEIMGVFSDSEILSQKTSTFITERILSDKLPNGLDNSYKITGDDIHRISNEINPRKDIDLEFILLFIENYKELINTEKMTSGFIARVYNSFREISESSTSHKGLQRHLKVTVDKCKKFFLINQFVNIDKNDRDLAELLSKYYSDEDVLRAAKIILEEASHTKRNIFTDNNDENEDLKGLTEDGLFYEWLPKQSFDNLILGKYCNCCSHIEGNGAGIMRASMCLNDCQNLVIRNVFGKIIAKATLSLNREKKYGVFNTLEVSMAFPRNDQLEKLFNAFMIGCQRFIDTYDKNYPDKKIETLTIGSHRNVLIDILEDHGYQDTTPLESIDYSKYGYIVNEKMVGKYSGDHALGQKLLYKRSNN